MPAQVAVKCIIKVYFELSQRSHKATTLISIFKLQLCYRPEEGWNEPFDFIYKVYNSKLRAVDLNGNRDLNRRSEGQHAWSWLLTEKQ